MTDHEDRGTLLSSNDTRAPQTINVSRLLSWILLALVVFALISIGGLIYFAGVVTDPTEGQTRLADYFGYTVATIIGSLIGILVGKLA
jgi:hypothetical protein